MNRIARGVGLQLNPTIINDVKLANLTGIAYDFAELLCDTFAGPLDSCYVIDPASRPLLEAIAEEHPIVAHGNYGAEFGFTPLEDTPSVKRHVAITHEMNSPWYCDHMFFGDRASSYMWSQPLQFTKKEIVRVAERAARLQDILKKPLLHENAFYYARFPGSDMPEAEFMAEFVVRAGTHLLLDLHNIYANSVNLEGYDAWQYLKTAPLDRVVEIHIAGGQWLGDYYHDLHNNAVPHPVWEMLDYVVKNAKNLEAITLEVQGPDHTSGSRQVDATWPEMIKADLTRAKSIWDMHKNPGGER